MDNHPPQEGDETQDGYAANIQGEPPAQAGNAGGDGQADNQIPQANQQGGQLGNLPNLNLLGNAIAAAAAAANPFNQQGQAAQNAAGQSQGGANANVLLGQLLAHPQGMALLGQLVAASLNNSTNTTHIPHYGAYPTAGANPIDIGTSYGIKQYSKAVDSLYSSSEEKFDLQPARLLNFIERIQTRAIESGWTPIFKVQNSARNNTVDDFLQRHGQISIQDVQRHEQTYLVQADSRNKQSSLHLQLCIYKSLTESAQAKILRDQQLFTINNMRGGLSYLKMVFLRTTAASNSNVSHIRRQLAKLPEYMRKVGSNIEKFNLHVAELQANLAHYGEESQDVLIHLFEGYRAASDKQFVSYIERKEEKHEDNSDSINEDKLMQDAENYYKTRVRDETWNRPDDHDQAILSLRAEIQQLKNSKKPEKKRDKRADGNKGKGPKKTRNKDVPTWKTTPPDAINKLKAKYIEGDQKAWYWCEKLQKYCRHHPDECGNQDKKNEKTKVKLKAAIAESYAPSDSESGSESDQE